MSIEDYFSDWKQRTWQCSRCEWSGAGSQASQELFAELFELNCPDCDARLATIPLPTHETIKRAAANGHPEAMSMLDDVVRADEFQADQKRSRRSLKRLKKIDGDNLEFTLTTIDTHDWMSPSHVVLLCNGTEIYRERSGFEHWEAVIEIGKVLVEQYRERIAWFDPGEAGVVLLGDSLSASRQIQSFLNRAGIAPPSGPWATTIT